MKVRNVTAGATEFTCNAYLVPGERSVLVDIGTVPGIETTIAEHVTELDAIVITHQHGDHIGELDAVLDAFDADLYTHSPHDHRTHTIEDGDAIVIGDESFEAIYTPGHAADHVAFVSESSIFSGDVVVYNDGAFEDGSFGRTDLPGQSRERLIESIKTILDRIPETVEHMYPGHGDDYRGDVREVIERALRRAERREPKYPE